MVSVDASNLVTALLHKTDKIFEPDSRPAPQYSSSILWNKNYIQNRPSPGNICASWIHSLQRQTSFKAEFNLHFIVVWLYQTALWGDAYTHG